MLLLVAYAAAAAHLPCTKPKYAFNTRAGAVREIAAAGRERFRERKTFDIGGVVGCVHLQGEMWTAFATPTYVVTLMIVRARARARVCV